MHVKNVRNNSNSNNIQDYLIQKQAIINDILQDTNLSCGVSPRLYNAMQYSVLSGGKRLRSILLLAVLESYEANIAVADIAPIIISIEYIHAMSLVHDDLPCMDNDDWRRNKLTCHKQYTESTALLTGDALFAHGIESCLQLQNNNINPVTVLQIMQELLKSTGLSGICGGQELDMYYSNANLPSHINLEQTLINIHTAKTGALIKASTKIGGILSNINYEDLELLEQYAHSIGLAFQIQDDIFDITSSQGKLGKSINKDIESNKLTFPSIYGLNRSKEIAQDLITESKKYLDKLDLKHQYLYNIADYVLDRSH